MHTGVGGWYLSLLLAAAPADLTLRQAQALGCIDWGKRQIEATGEAAPSLQLSDPALLRRTAEEVARRDVVARLRATLFGTAFDANSRVAALLQSSAPRAAGVATLLETYVVTETRYFADGGVQVAARLGLDDGLMQLLGAAPAAAGDDDDDDLEVTVWAGSLPLQPCLQPRLLNPEQTPLVGAAAVPQVIPRYIHRRAGALQAVGHHGMLLRAQRLAADAATDVVLQPADARRLQQLLGAARPPQRLQLTYLLP